MITYTPDTIKRIQLERMKQLEAEMDRLNTRLERLGREHAEHYAMMMAVEDAQTEKLPTRHNMYKPF